MQIIVNYNEGSIFVTWRNKISSLLRKKNEERIPNWRTTFSFFKSVRNLFVKFIHFALRCHKTAVKKRKMYILFFPTISRFRDWIVILLPSNLQSLFFNFNALSDIFPRFISNTCIIQFVEPTSSILFLDSILYECFLNISSFLASESCVWNLDVNRHACISSYLI